MTIDQLMFMLEDFRDARNWAKFHTPAELSRALMVEAAELNRLMLWNRTPEPQARADEIADILIYCLYLCMEYGLEPEAIIYNKIVKNEAKYPVAVDHAAAQGWKA